MRTLSIPTLILSIILSGCGGSGTRDTDTAGLPPDARDLVGATSDVHPSTIEEWKQELIRADEEFSATIVEDGLSFWGSFFAEDGAVVRQGVGVIRGREAIQASMDAAAGAVVDFRWFPERAEVSASGDLGWTTGNYRTLVAGPDGVEMVSTGVYVSIWRRQETGEWKVEMDLGNPVTGPTPVPETDTGAGVPQP